MNQKKYVLCLVLAICSMSIAGLYTFYLLLGLETLLNYRPPINSVVSTISIWSTVINSLIYIAVIIMSIFLCVRTCKRNGNVKAFLLTMVILLSVCCLLIILKAVGVFGRGFSIITFLLYGGLLALSCVALGTNGNAPDAPRPTYAQPMQYSTPAQAERPAAAQNSLDAKLNELKKMKDLMIISDEQYETAIKKIIMQELEC